MCRILVLVCLLTSVISALAQPMGRSASQVQIETVRQAWARKSLNETNCINRNLQGNWTVERFVEKEIPPDHPLAIEAVEKCKRNTAQFQSMTDKELDDRLFVMFGALGVVMGLYLFPSIIAILRGHQNAAAIVVVNLFVGWTFIGWVVAMVWACTSKRSRMIIDNF